MKILSVIPLKKGIPKGALTYFTSLPVPAGHIVSVPIRNKSTLALVLSSQELEEAKGGVKKLKFNLKKITGDRGPSLFPSEFLDAVSDVSRYFALPPHSAITSLIPNIFIEEYSHLAKIKQEEINSPQNTGNNLRAEKLLFQYPLPDRISIHKTLVRESFARGKSIFIILPTEGDVNKFASLLSRGIEQFTFTFSSGASPKKNLKRYEELAASSHPVLILGTPPFLSMPKCGIGTVILEHESSSAYRTVSRPYLDLRVFAEIYASKIGAKFILADDLLRFETIARKDEDHLHPLYPLSFRIDFPGIIEIKERTKKDPKKDPRGGFQVFSEDSLQIIGRALRSEKNVVIFSLRKGLATQTVCRDCGETLQCENCFSPLVLYMGGDGKKRMFVCNRCEKDWGADITCRGCGSWNLMPLGIGTDAVYEEIKKNFPKVKIFQLDKESAKSASGAKKIAREFEEETGAILVCTEMAFFYLEKQVSLSVIASFDSLWSIPNYKMSEKILQLAIRIAEITAEKIIIETKNPNDPAIRAIASGSLLEYFREELEDRKKLGYPPYKRFIKITYQGDKEETRRARQFLEETFSDYSPEIFSGFISKNKGKYVTNALVKLEPRKWSLFDISAGSSIDETLLSKISALPSFFEVQVDPEDLL
ncbi:MAG: Primosomal protein N' (Replication factor Y) [Candidatus Nomurabacteria bacterium GW2011_GWB1_47_6]|uniref:Primosomal protein N' (Replication factor Y) n=1 Tax=Candidatus Nomurabacteria bacterium GW2011_GWB1_47_6 TaxID=1618749 RepID=A0A0G1T1I4_9BACT|nr:MAG: Primosomal protein N' (Replication factor Y) [Candidatus Nomurabacteria bacterium GW2011_GWB1_47_6]